MIIEHRLAPFAKEEKPYRTAAAVAALAALADAAAAVATFGLLTICHEVPEATTVLKGALQWSGIRLLCNMRRTRWLISKATYDPWNSQKP